MGITLPNRPKGRRIVNNRIIPLFRTCKPLRALLTPKAADVQKEEIRLLNGFIMHLMWAGSAASMKSDPMCRVFNDEIDDFEAEADRQASAIELTAKRLVTYEEKAIQVNIGTPTTQFGNVAQLQAQSRVKLYYYVPCPHCGTYQRLILPQLKWKKFDSEDRVERAALILQHRAAWYECEQCKKQIDEAKKLGMVRAGRWSSEEGYVVDAAGTRHEDAENVERWPVGTWVAMHISQLYCLWVSWAKIAAERVMAADNRSRMFDFRTQTLGEPFEQQIERPRPGLFAEKSERAELEEGVVPRWAWRLVVTIDTQKDYFFVVVRAWGAEMRSARVWHGRVETFEALDRLCFGQPWRVQDETGLPMLPDLVLIDSGGTKLEDQQMSRTQEVYRWALNRRARVRPIKGASHKRGTYRVWPGEGEYKATKEEKQRGRPVRIWYFEKQGFEDELQDLADRGVDEKDERPEIWGLNKRNDEEYNRHLSNAHKIMVRVRGGLAMKWVPVQTGSRVDYRDCEVYSVMAAFMLRVHLLPPEVELEKLREARRQAAEKRKKPPIKKERDQWNPTPIAEKWL